MRRRGYGSLLSGVQPFSFGPRRPVSEITWQMLPPDLLQTPAGQGVPPASRQPLASPREHTAHEAQQLRELCQQYHGDVSAVVKAVGVHRTTIVRRLKAYGITYARKRISYPAQKEHHELTAAAVSGASGSRH